MAVFLEVARTGLAAVLLHPLRSLVTVVALVAVLLPYVACLGLSRGLQDQAETSVRLGADLYVIARQFGRPVPIPLSVMDKIGRLSGVADCTPRIVGSLVLGKNDEPAVVVGMDPRRYPGAANCVEGRLPSDGGPNEVVVGTELARRLSLKVGAVIPYFYRNARGERLTRVVGLFRGDAGIWQSQLMFTTLETAAHLFDQQETATDILVWCKPGQQAEVAAALQSIDLSGPAARDKLQPHVTARDDVAALFRGGLVQRESIVHLHFVLACAVGLLVVLVTSGLGMAGRRREIGILKATGWQTDQILLRGAVESLVLALIGSALSVILAFVWLKWLGGFGIAGIFITGVEAAPGFPVPWRLTPIPALLAFLLGGVVVLSGTLYSSWRVATAPPSEALR